MQIYEPTDASGTQTVSAPYFYPEHDTIYVEMHARGKASLTKPKKQFALKTLDSSLNGRLISAFILTQKWFMMLILTQKRKLACLDYQRTTSGCGTDHTQTTPL